MLRNIKLTAESLGISTGPFDVVGSDNSTLLTGVSRNDLLTGVNVLIDDTIITSLTIVGVGRCDNSAYVPLPIRYAYTTITINSSDYYYGSESYVQIVDTTIDQLIVEYLMPEGDLSTIEDFPSLFVAGHSYLIVARRLTSYYTSGISVYIQSADNVISLTDWNEGDEFDGALTSTSFTVPIDYDITQTLSIQVDLYRIN